MDKFRIRGQQPWGTAADRVTGKRKKRRERKSTQKCICFLFLLLCILLLCILVLGKKISVNSYFASRYPVQGVDVSHYQGDIDWDILGGQDIDFVYIKATEGSSYVDQTFASNWKEAEEAGLYVGAYHFFSFDSGADTQAQLFIQTVGDLSGRLIPAVDVEYYGDKEIHPPGREEVVPGLRQFLQILEDHYHIKPVIYTTYTVYAAYIEGEFEEYPLWIRNVYFPPDVDKRGKWDFWQYSDTALLEGYRGEEHFIDRNVFRGSLEELQGFLVP